MRIILLGAPGTGKGTQGIFIGKKYNIPQISIGDMLRENIHLKNKIGKIIKKTVENGNLVSNKIVCTILKRRIIKKDCQNGFLLDGFPRTIEQANYLSENKIKIDYVLEFSMPYKLILERISGRRIHVQSGRIYHIKYNPPKNEQKDDLTGEILITRKDDKKSSIKKRLEEYKRETYPLIEYYLNEDKLGKLKFFKIDASDSLLNIKHNIKTILKE